MSNGSVSIASEIVKAPAQEWLQQQYGVYSLYVLRDRALVGIDGLKPVVRRILYSFFADGITPSSDYVKSARACANVMSYHPHGNSSIESSAAGMAQTFTTRVPLTDPHGSVGLTHGDTPASARYLELRLTKAAMELVKEVSEGAVVMGKNFDGTLDEPSVLPVRWPEHIINGSQGIAVGYASNMFAHNPDEVMKTLQAVLRNPDITVDEILKTMPGPDLPTGGELFGVEGVKDYYETGSGKFIVRARFNVEPMSRGKAKIVFYELPFQVSPESVIESVRKLQSAGKLKEIASIKDLSDMKNGMRLVVETKAGTNHLAVLNILFKNTTLEKSFSVNSTVLVNNSPTKISMLNLLKNFVEFRKECTLNKAKNKVGKIERRLHQLNAMLAVLVDIDACIAIIRNADSAEDANAELMQTFNIDEDQADYILSMQLRRLTKADSIAITNENDELLEEKARLESLLSSDDVLADTLFEDFENTRKVITSKRRTVISGMTIDDMKASVRVKAQAARDGDKSLPCYITRFVDGRVLKTSEPFSYKAGLKKYSYGPIAEQIKIRTQDNVLIVGSNGIAYRIPANYITTDLISDSKGIGVHLPAGHSIVALAKETPQRSDVGLILASKNGEAKLVKPDFPKKDEFTVFALVDGDKLISGQWISKSLTGAHVVTISSNSNVLIYPANTLRLTGAAAGGVRSQKVADGDEVIYFGLLPSIKEDNLMILSKGASTVKLTPISEIAPKSKGAQGMTLHKLKKDEPRLVTAGAGSNLVMTLTDLHNSINLPPATKRAAVGIDFKMDVAIGESSLIKE